MVALEAVSERVSRLGGYSGHGGHKVSVLVIQVENDRR